MITRRSHLPLIAALFLVSSFATACSSGDDAAEPAEPTAAADLAPTDAPVAEAPPAEAPEVVIDASDFGYSGPSEVPAGLTKLTMMNKGTQMHQVAMMQLTGGKTYQDYTAYAETATETDPMPEWLVPAGGPVAAVPSMQASAFVDLQAGTYVLVCNIPDAQGVPHFKLGQVGTLQVTEAAADAAVAAAPEADQTIGLADFAFNVPAELSAGAHVFDVTNEGAQPHEAVLMKLDEGATAGDVAAAFAPGASGPPPAMPVGGVAGIAPGASQFFPADLSPGRYALLCFYPDAASGKVHAELGMMAEFDVK